MAAREHGEIMAHLEANQVSLFYEWHSSSEGNNDIPVVFVNGLLADTSVWGFQVPDFAARFRVLLYDCRGQGKSDKPPGPYPPALHAQDLVALLDRLNIAQAHIVGLSNGGAVALTFATDHPQRVARLVVADTYAHTDTLMQAKLESWLLALDAGGLALRFDVAIPWVWGKTFLAKNQSLIAPLRAKATQADPQAVRSLIRGAMDYDIRARLETIQAPTLVLAGEEDILTPPWYAREVARGIPSAQLCLVPQAGHALSVERPNIFNALTLAFLRE